MTEQVMGSGAESIESLAGHVVPIPELAESWTLAEARAKKKARFRIYLGYAPGVGKTYAMLSEGHRRHDRGTDVVVGYVETYGRTNTLEMLQGLEIIPRKRLEYRGTTFEELDADAVIARKPEVALIDELPHTNIPGSRRAKRWEDVCDVLAAGIIVITTVNIQHLASLNDVVAGITGIRQQEMVPDWMLEIADDIELVDVSPFSLQRRMIHGNIYPDSHKADLALRRYFTDENLTALRELALMKVANRVDAELITRWQRGALPDTRERVLVCVGQEEFSEDLVRRGARMAQRSGGDLFVIHVRTSESAKTPAWLHKIEKLAQDCGGEMRIVEDESAINGVLAFAYQNHITQCVVGAPLKTRMHELIRGSFINRLTRRAQNIDIHVISRKGT
ncbi:MAG: universal stress protein [Actinomycetota bacterium]